MDAYDRNNPENSDWSGDEDSLPDLDDPMPMIDLLGNMSDEEDNLEVVDESEDEVVIIIFK